LLTSTALSLVVIPVAYTYVDDLLVYGRSLVRRA
jgi:Cu/Ag efflux pump CusA